MYGTLQCGSLPAAQRDRADEQGQRQQNSLLAGRPGTRGMSRA